jgi:methionyl-tRNA formyltransferase
MGTPEFAVPSLAALVDGGYAIAAVITQPDRPAGRGRAHTPSPVKQYAVDHGLLVIQPTTLRPTDVVAQLADLHPDVIVVAAFGMILRAEVLNLPLHGCLNVHASLLPRHRGASPITAAILEGDAVTGCTIMRLDEGMDTGPILAQSTLEIRADDTTAALSARLAQQGADLLAVVLPLWLASEIAAQPQPTSGVTLCRPLRKEQGKVAWGQPAIAIERMARAYQPWPGAFTSWQGQLLKIVRAHVATGSAEPGRVIAHGEGVAVGTGDGLLALDEVQIAGRRAMAIGEFLRGQRAIVGAVLT